MQSSVALALQKRILKPVKVMIELSHECQILVELENGQLMPCNKETGCVCELDLDLSLDSALLTCSKPKTTSEAQV